MLTWCKRSAQPGTGEGVRIEARRAKPRRASGRGLVYESRFGEAEHAQRHAPPAPASRAKKKRRGEAQPLVLDLGGTVATSWSRPILQHENAD